MFDMHERLHCHVSVGLPPVCDFPGCPRFVPSCPASRQDQPRDTKRPRFQGAVKMTTIMIITIVIIGVIVLIRYRISRLV